MNSWFLSTVNPWLTLVALGLLSAGVYVLYRAWQKPQRHWLLISCGWGLLLFAHWPFFNAFGVDRAWALAAISPGLIGLLVIALRTPWQKWNREARTQPARAQLISTEKISRANFRKKVKHVLVQIVVVGLFSLSASLGIALAVFGLLETSVVNRAITAAMVALLLWPIFMVWSRSRESLIKPALIFGCASLGGWLFTPAIF